VRRFAAERSLGRRRRDAEQIRVVAWVDQPQLLSSAALVAIAAASFVTARTRSRCNVWPEPVDIRVVLVSAVRVRAGCGLRVQAVLLTCCYDIPRFPCRDAKQGLQDLTTSVCVDGSVLAGTATDKGRSTRARDA